MCDAKKRATHTLFAGSAEISNSIFNTFWEIEEKERRKEARQARAAANGEDYDEEETLDDV